MIFKTLYRLGPTYLKDYLLPHVLLLLLCSLGYLLLAVPTLRVPAWHHPVPRAFSIMAPPRVGEVVIFFYFSYNCLVITVSHLKPREKAGYKYLNT